MTSTNRSLGDTFEKDGTFWRVVRITHTQALHEVGSIATVVDERYIELLSQHGMIDFEVLTHEEKPYEGFTSTIKAPEPLTWKGE